MNERRFTLRQVKKLKPPSSKLFYVVVNMMYVIAVFCYK